MRIIKHSNPTISIKQYLYLSWLFITKKFSSGEVRVLLERRMSQRFDKKYALAVSSGSAALHLVLKTIITDGDDEILLSGLTCVDLTNAILLAGGKAVYLNVNEKDSIYIEDILHKITPKTKGIIIDHLFGKRTYVEGLENFKIEVIEDCTHSYSRLYRNSHVIASFGATKVISGCEGGIILTDDDNVKDRITDYLSHDANIRYPYKLSDIHSGIAVKQLEELNWYADKRLKIAKRYNENFKKFENVELPNPADYDVFYRYVIKLNSMSLANNFISFAKAAGVNCEKPIEPHNDACTLYSIRDSSDRFVSLPIYPSLNFWQRIKVIRIICEAYKRETL